MFMKKLQVFELTHVMVLILFLIFINPCAAQEKEGWSLSYADAMAKAKKSGKMVLLNFAGSDWCKPCIRLTKEVFEREAFMQYADDRLELVLLDFPRLKKNKLPAQLLKQNEALAERYNKEGQFPLVILIDHNEKVIAKTGYIPGGVHNFISYLQEKLNGTQ